MFVIKSISDCNRITEVKDRYGGLII